MAEVFSNNPAEPRARFISAVWALLMSAPWRISELLRLHVDAECEGDDEDGIVSYGLRYYGAKGFEYNIKWMGIPVKWNSVSGDLEHGFRRSGTLVGA